MAEAVIERSGLDALLEGLRGDGYTTVGPTIDEGAIVYGEISGTADLPIGWVDRQEPGRYRLERRGDERLFGYVVGPRSWKRFLYPQETVVWRGTLDAESGWSTLPPPPPPRYAFIGVRGCELAAIAIQDRVFIAADRPVDATYAARRTEAFIVAVDCDEPGANCFCASMGTGPRPGAGYDLALTELGGDERPRYLVRTGSDRGEALLATIAAPPAGADDLAERARVMDRAEQSFTHELDTTDIRDLLVGNLNHPHWEEVAQRCLACTNCTLVCPTCFCSTVEEGMSLDGQEASRTRRWDSCFSLDFSYIHGGPMRPSAAARYRQWLTHKLATWFDQFGVSGCVGCGRCITWCPVGIDLTSEVAAIRSDDRRTSESDLPEVRT